MLIDSKNLLSWQRNSFEEIGLDDTLFKAEKSPPAWPFSSAPAERVGLAFTSTHCIHTSEPGNRLFKKAKKNFAAKKIFADFEADITKKIGMDRKQDAMVDLEHVNKK